MIGKFYGLQVLGWFSLVDRTMGIPSTLVGQSVSQVYMTEAANLAHEDPNALNDLFIKTLKRILQMGAVPFVVFFFLAPDIFSFVFNPSWREAGVYAKLLAAMYYVSIAAAPLLTTMTILEKQSWQLCWDIGRLISTVGALLAGHVLGWSARNSILAYGIALFASYCIHLLLSRALIKQLIKSHEARQVNRNDNKN
jgi:O-antigen/teichoic acid export membrane protein